MGGPDDGKNRFIIKDLVDNPMNVVGCRIYLHIRIRTPPPSRIIMANLHAFFKIIMDLLTVLFLDE